MINRLEECFTIYGNTSEVKDMGWMFNECQKLKEIKGINNFNTSEVTNMSAMFQECYELEYLNLSNFNTHNVIDMEAMFNHCHKLKEIKGINNFDLTNVKNKNNIFNPLSSPDIVPPKDKVVTCVGCGLYQESSEG